MCGERYRLKSPTHAIVQHDGLNCPTTVPSGAVIRVVAVPIDGNRLVDVIWDGKTVMMFKTDIQERCTRLEQV